MILTGSEITAQLGDNILIEPFDSERLNPNSYNRSHHWSKAGRPIRRKGKFASQRPMFVCGVIGPTLGNVLYHYGTAFFKAKDM